MKATFQELPSSEVRAVMLVPFLVTLMLSAFSTNAHGDPLAKPANAVAREHLTAGNRLYRVREFEKAIEEYKAGAVKEDAPVFYYNLGQCYRQLGRHEDAIWHYERFVERGKPTGEIEVAVKDFIAQMRSELQKKAMAQPPVEPAPAPKPPATNEQEPSRSRPPAEERRGMPTRRKLALGLGVGGVAVAGIGLAFGLRAQSFKDDAAEICPMTSCERADEANQLIDRGKTNALYTNVALGIGGAAILGAVVLCIIGSPAEHERTAIVPRVSSSFAGVAASGRF